MKTDSHHLRHVSNGGGDELNNLVPLCRQHHVEIHNYGMSKFISLYPAMRDWLVEIGRTDKIGND